MRSRAALVVLALVLSACGSDEESIPVTPTEASSRRPDPEPSHSIAPAADPALDRLLEDTASPSLGDEIVAPAPGLLADQAPPPRGCALQSEGPIRVLPSGGPPAVIAHGDVFLVAAYDAEGARILRARPGARPEPLASIALEAPPPASAPPGLARTSAHEASIAMIDGRARVLEASFDPMSPGMPSPRTIAEGGADVRFSPAVRAVGTRRVIAWTDGRATPMRLRVAVLERANVVSEHDVTPVAGGGAAPFFVEGEGAPVLFFIDPRIAVSVVHRVSIGADGAPAPTEVQRPLHRAAQPASIAAARAGGRTWLAYAADGSFATRAVGLLDAEGAEPAAPLVPGLGYGDPLTLDALASGNAVIFAAEAPSEIEASAPHEVRLRRVDAEGAGDPLVIAAPATDPAIARRSDGLIAVAYRTGAAVVLQYARCAE